MKALTEMQILINLSKMIVRNMRSKAVLQVKLYHLKHKRPFSMNYRERGYHAPSVYLTQDTQRMETIRLK